MTVGILIGCFALLFYGFLFSELIHDIIKDCKGADTRGDKDDLHGTI